MDIKHAEGIASTLYKIDAAALRTALQIADDDTTVDEKKLFDFLATKQGEVLREREDRGFKRAEKTILTKLEKDIRQEFGIDDTEAKGLDLVRAVVDTVKLEADKGGKEKLTDDLVKKHPLYLQLETAKKQEIDNLKKDYDQKLEAEKSAREYESLLSQVDQMAETIFSELGTPILPEDQAIAAKHKKRLLIDELRAFKFQKNGDDILPLNSDGSRLEDKAGNAKNLKDLVTDIAKSNFQFKASQDRKMPGNGGSGGGGGADKKYAGAAPKDVKEYVGLLTSKDLSLEQKAEIKEQYGKTFAN